MNRITNYIQKESNNVKLLLMLFLSLLVLTIATKGQFFSLNQMQLVAYLILYQILQRFQRSCMPE